MRGIMNASLLQTDSLAEQFQSLLVAVDRLGQHVYVLTEIKKEFGRVVDVPGVG